MLRENYNNDEIIEDENINNFMDNIIKLCKKHKLWFDSAYLDLDKDK